MTSVYNYLVGALPFQTSSSSDPASNASATANSNTNGNSATASHPIINNANDTSPGTPTEATSLLKETPKNGTSSSTFAGDQNGQFGNASETMIDAKSSSDSANINGNGELRPLNDLLNKNLTIQTQTQPDGGDLEDPLQKQALLSLPKGQRPPTVYEYYFSPDNPTVQRYYRFTSTPLTPIAALHKRPSGGTPTRNNDPSTVAGGGGGVTGLLRRSAVVPSHGTDATGQWILVSVGGRSGWARKKSPEHQYAGFTSAETFQATEGWMGNHAFLFQGKPVLVVLEPFGVFCTAMCCTVLYLLVCLTYSVSHFHKSPSQTTKLTTTMKPKKGKMMLGSDAPSLFFTNGLLVVGAIMHFGIVLPKLAHLYKHDDHDEVHTESQTGNYYHLEQPWLLLSSPFWMFWISLTLFLLSWIFLWVCACMDPGILPGESLS